MKRVFLMCLALVFLMSGISLADLNDGLTAYYPFNANANDESGNGNHGTVNGPILTADRLGRAASAYSFDGVNDYISIYDSNLIDFDYNDDFTVALEIKVASIQPDQSNSDNSIIEKWSGGTPYSYVIRYINQTGQIYVARHSRPDSYMIVSKKTVNDNQFHHVAFKKEGLNLYLFIDGIQDGTTIDESITTKNKSPLFLGKRGNNINYFKGVIDELRLYNRALSTSEIKELSGTSDSRLKADFQFNNSFKSTIGSATLIENGKTIFDKESVDGVLIPILKFQKGSGLRLENCSNTIPNNNYSIVVLFSFDDTRGRKRIIDFKNRKSETGLFVFNNNIQFFNIATGSGGQIKENKYVQVVITRDKQKNVNCYVDGVRGINFNDFDDLAQIDDDNILSFFRDTSGSVVRIRLYDDALSKKEVELLDRLPLNPNPKISGCIAVESSIKDSKAMLLQSGEIHQTVLLDTNGCYFFNRYNNIKPFTIIIRGNIDSDHILSE